MTNLHEETRYRLKLLLWLIFIKLVIFSFILFGPVGLMPDEAQYWTWSRKLSYGYYSKPPAIAWQIAAGCFFFGDTELGVRIANGILSCALGLAIYWLARQVKLPPKLSYVTALSFSLSPLGIFSGFLATVDCGFVLFWTIACALFIKELEKPQEVVSYTACGIAIAIGALWKWAIYFLWIPIFIYSWSIGKYSTKKCIVGIVTSLLGLIPSVIWNVRHNWATFQHVWATVDITQKVTVQSTSNTVSFVGAQLALASPLLFILILWATVVCAKNLRKREYAIQFCWWAWTGLFLMVLGASFLRKMQGNWVVYAYPTAFVVLVSMLYEKYRNKVSSIITVSCGISVALIALVFSLPWLQKHSTFGSKIPWKANPWRQGLGIRGVEQKLQDLGFNSETEFVFSDRYQDASQLAFYGPGIKKTFFLNISQLRKNQFSYWPSMRERCIGKTGWFVSFCDNAATYNYEEAKKRFAVKLAPYFSRVEPIAVVPLYEIDGKIVKAMLVFRCVQYNGKLPQENTLF